MKKLIFSLLGAVLLWPLGSRAQSIPYTVLHDGAPSPRLNVNFEYMSIDMGVSNLDGTAFNFGTNGFFEPVKGLGAQWNVRRSLFALGKLGYSEYPGNVDLSLGGYFMFGARDVKKPTRVVLKTEYKGSEYTTNVQGDRIEKRTEEVTFITIPATRTVSNGLRGGFYLKRGPFNTESIDEEGVLYPLDEMSLTSMGVYAGITRRSLKNIFVDAKGYGVQFNSIGDDIALDLLIVPVNIFRDLNTEGKPNVTPQIRDLAGKLPIGFRIGWYRYQIEQKTRTGKKFGMSAAFETGYKPYQGFFITAGLGITLVKK